MQKTTLISLRVSPEMKEELERRAREDRRPLAQYLAVKLEDMLLADGWKPKEG